MEQHRIDQINLAIEGTDHLIKQDEIREIFSRFSIGLTETLSGDEENLVKKRILQFAEEKNNPPDAGYQEYILRLLELYFFYAWTTCDNEQAKEVLNTYEALMDLYMRACVAALKTEGVIEVIKKSIKRNEALPLARSINDYDRIFLIECNNYIKNCTSKDDLQLISQFNLSDISRLSRSLFMALKLVRKNPKLTSQHIDAKKNYIYKYMSEVLTTDILISRDLSNQNGKLL